MSFNRSYARHGPAPKNKQEFTPNDWKEYSERNIAISNKAIKGALHLQTSIDGLLARNTSNLRTQKVNNEIILNHTKSDICRAAAATGRQRYT